MGRKTTEKGRIVQEYCKKYPNYSSHLLAKVIFKENKMHFPDAESTRSLVRIARGKSGDRFRKTVKDKSLYDKGKRPLNPYSIPKSEAKDFKPFYLPKDRKRILFLSDIHLPYHNVEAITVALDYGKSKQVDTIWINGDMLDMYQASFHDKNPTEYSIMYEFEQGIEFLKMLKKNFPKAQIYYKEGNHETRWMRYLRKNAPIIFGHPEFELPHLLKLNEIGVHWIPNMQLSYFGKLAVIHGNEIKGSGGVMVSRTMYLKAGESVIAGDKHKTNEYTKMTIGGSMIGTWSVACMCELNPEYLPMGNDWNLGFAFIEIKDNGEFIVHNKRIHKGKIY